MSEVPRSGGFPAPDGEEHTGPVIRDKRRIDPVTGQPRDAGRAAGPAGASPGSAPGGAPAAGAASTAGATASAPADSAVVEDLRRQVAERTGDLQRLQAEYANYRRRVDRDRELVQELALANVLANLLPVLDDIGRARDHGELTGGFRAVADALESTVEKLGLSPYGTSGDPFDPTVHEALLHSHSSDVTEATCVQILQPGYRLGSRILRPARVAVAEPDESASPLSASAESPSAERAPVPAPEDAVGQAGIWDEPDDDLSPADVSPDDASPADDLSRTGGTSDRAPDGSAAQSVTRPQSGDES